MVSATEFYSNNINIIKFFIFFLITTILYKLIMVFIIPMARLSLTYIVFIFPLLYFGIKYFIKSENVEQTDENKESDKNTESDKT